MTTAAESSEATEAAAPTGEPITIGTMIWSNPIAALDRRVPGIQAAVDAINTAGGVGGRPLEWVLCEAADPNEGSQCARDFVEQGVVATVADGNLIAEAESTAILAEAGIPQIDPFLSVPEAVGSPNVYLISPGVPLSFAAVVQAMDLEGLESLHLLQAAIGTAEANAAAVRTAAEFYGIEVRGTTEVPLQAADYTPMVSAADAAGADTNVAIIGPFMTDLLLQSAQQLALPLRIGISERQFSQEQYELYGQAGGPLEDAILVDTLPPISEAENFPEIERALDEIAVYFEDSGDERAAPGRLNNTVIQAWFAVQAFNLVAADLDEVTAATVKDALDTVQNLDLGVLDWTPSREGPPGFPRASHTLFYVSTVEDGRSVLVQDEPIDAAEPFRG